MLFVENSLLYVYFKFIWLFWFWPMGCVGKFNFGLISAGVCDYLYQSFDGNILAGQARQYALLLNEVFPSQNRRNLKKAYR
jgi:hypothetical protein